MFGLGPTELIVIFVLALLVLGPEKIPTAAAQFGKAVRNFRKLSQNLRDQIDDDGQLGRSFSDLHSALRGDVTILESEERAKTSSKALPVSPVEPVVTADEQIHLQPKLEPTEGLSGG